MSLSYSIELPLTIYNRAIHNKLLYNEYNMTTLNDEDELNWNIKKLLLKTHQIKVTVLLKKN